MRTMKKGINRKKIAGWCMGLALLFAGAVACDDEEYQTEYMRTKAAFLEAIEGKISALQWWRTAVTLHVNVKNVTSALESAYSVGEGVPILYDQKELSVDGSVCLTVPQGAGREVLIVVKDGSNLKNVTVRLTGALTEEVTLDMLSSTTLREATANTSSIYGKDIQPNVGYTEIGRLAIETVELYTKEGMDPTEKGLIDNYELISNGPFYVTMYYGYTGTYVPRILGYYRHSQGTYKDLELVDLVDTHSYDYLNGQAKLQYQLDGNTKKWYDANFDHLDGFEPPYTPVEARLDDDAYGIHFVMQKYGDRMSLARGLTYKIDVKPGDRVGFYLKNPRSQNDIQRELMVQTGVPSAVLPEPFYETNWSAKRFHTNGKHRSILIQENGYTIMGMEDAGNGGDLDCNDVLFGVYAKMESEMPTIITPEADNLIVSSGEQVWTVAFEDLYREADFDFNDAVIQLTPDYEQEVCAVSVMAAGSNDRMYLHYNGPEGDQNLGEMHALLGESELCCINTESTVPMTPFVPLDDVKWPKHYTMAEDARRFYIEVKRGECEDCSDLITLPYEPGEIPQALLVAGEWKWPKELMPIYSAYTNFPEWAKDATDMTYWDWYLNAEKGMTVVY